jgi:hypothetical protein
MKIKSLCQIKGAKAGTFSLKKEARPNAVGLAYRSHSKNNLFTRVNRLARASSSGSGALTTLAPRFSGLFAAPFMSGAQAVGGSSAFPGYLLLLFGVHRGKTTV